MRRMWPSLPLEPSRGGWSIRRSRASCPPNGRHRDVSTSSEELRSGAGFGPGSLSSLSSSGDPLNSSGMLQLSVLMPFLTNVPRQRAKEEVENIGATWTLGDSGSVQNAGKREDTTDSSAAAGINSELLQSLEEQMARQDGTCGICLEPFAAGSQLTALPCAIGGCPSVWHTDCIREWLCQGHATACPLCRCKVNEESHDDATSSGSVPAFALEVRAALPLVGGGHATRRFTHDGIPELLFLALISMGESQMQGIPGQPLSSVEVAWANPARRDLHPLARLARGSASNRSPSWLSMLRGHRSNGRRVISENSAPSADRPSSEGRRDPFTWLAASASRRSGAEVEAVEAVPLAATDDPDTIAASPVHGDAEERQPSTPVSTADGVNFSSLRIRRRLVQSDSADGNGGMQPGGTLPWPRLAPSVPRGASAASSVGTVAWQEARSSDQPSPPTPMLPSVPTEASRLRGTNWRSRLVARGARSLDRVRGTVRRPRGPSIGPSNLSR